MTTTLNAARIELSKQLGDYWEGTTTSAGSSTTVIDTALKAKNNNWIDANAAEMYDFITSATCLSEERRITALDNTSGTLTVLAHTGTGPGISATYEVHRLFSPGEKRRALISAARLAFPTIHKTIRNEAKVSGNWLKDGSIEVWTASTTPTYWTATTLTATQTSTAGLFKHGSYSAKLSGAAGTFAQSITNNEDLKRLAGQNVTFTLQVKTDTASSVRISVYDGTTYTYSDYNTQVTGWTLDSEPMTVTALIKDNPGAITFTVHSVSATATVYVDDARVICGAYNKVYIGDLGLQRNTPHQVLIEPSYYYQGDSWYLLHNIEYDAVNGFMYLPDDVGVDRRLRIVGIGVLDFLASGVSSTAWTATIDIDSPQLDILIARAIVYLYTQMSLPNFETGTRQAYMEMLGFWRVELTDKIQRFGMQAPAATQDWSV